ncbi:MAG TPA: hypothetical protein VEV15_12110 [Flavisolibacter sp.]|nr:hypothetical protein [Flavisolibacter sp.]
MNADKEKFLRYQLITLLRRVPSDTPPQWGKMSLQQMIEHFADSVRIASGKKIYTDIVTPEEHLQKMRDFILSDKPFKENTVNPLMPVLPAPVQTRSVEEALQELQAEINYFFAVFEKNNLQVTRNPFFGDLNFEENVHLLYKHALHHLKQFGVTVDNEIKT